MQEMIFLHVQLEGLPLLDICRVLGNLYRLRCTLSPPNNSFQMRQERLNILERLDKQEVELSDLKKKIKKQPRHSDVGSSNFPLDEQTIKDEAKEMIACNKDKV